MISERTEERRSQLGSTPAHDGHGHAPRLAAHQVGCGGDLVGNADLGDHELAAQRVLGALQVDDRGDACAADGHIGDAAPPRAPERVGHDHPDGAPRQAPDAVADLVRRTVAVIGQQRCVAALHIRQVDACVGADEPVLGLADDEVAAASQDPHRLAFHERLVRQRVVRVDLLHRPFGLGDDLLGHHQHVAVTQPRRQRLARLGDHGAQIGAERDLADALHGMQFDGHAPLLVPAASSAVAASRAARSASAMIVSVTTGVIPASATAGASSASAWSITSVPARPA